MKYLKINLEDFGGYDVNFSLSHIEKKCRMRLAAKLLETDLVKFENELKANERIFERSIGYFSSQELCDGPAWDALREAVVDMICKYEAMGYRETYLLEG